MDASNRARIENDLRQSISVLAKDIGERNLYHPASLEHAAAWITQQFKSRGYSEVRRKPVRVDGRRFELGDELHGPLTGWNIEAELPGASDDLLVIGAHYDSKVAMPGWHDHWPPTPERPGTPGANDNASGIATLLYVAEQLHSFSPKATIRFVAFVNEEPPFFQTSAMGSLCYAESLADEGKRDVKMVSLETLGCFSARHPKKRVGIVSLFGLKDSADYVAFLGNMQSRNWMESAAKDFSEHSSLTTRTLAVPAIFESVAWSDDWAFWTQHYQAFSITDTAYLRSDSYHELNDTADGIDYEALAGVADAVVAMVRSLAMR